MAEEHSALSSIKDIGITHFYKLFQINVEEAKEVDTKQWDPDSDEEDKDDLDESGESEEEEYSDWTEKKSWLLIFFFFWLNFASPRKGAPLAVCQRDCNSWFIFTNQNRLWSMAPLVN